MIEGSCLCGGVRVRITGPALSASYCHCTHCQKRTGTAASASLRVAREDFELVAGAELVRSFTPPGGRPKAFCTVCGSALFSGDLGTDAPVSVRLGLLDDDPGVRPQAHNFVASAAAWEAIADDGLPRNPGPPERY